MKSIFYSSIVFLLLIISINFSIKYINNICMKYLKITYALEEIVQKEDWKGAYDLSCNFVTNWNTDSPKLSVFIHHGDVDEISTELLKLTQYTKNQNKDESLPNIHVIKLLLKHIINSEKINFQNIF